MRLGCGIRLGCGARERQFIAKQSGHNVALADTGNGSEERSHHLLFVLHSNYSNHGLGSTERVLQCYFWSVWHRINSSDFATEVTK
jgi:hypothetical protein